MWELVFDVMFIMVYISLLTVEWSKILAPYMSQGCFQAGCWLDPRHRDQSPRSQHLISSPCRSLVLGDKAPLHVTKPQYCIGLHPYTTEFPDSSPNCETSGECSPGSAVHSLQLAAGSETRWMRGHHSPPVPEMPSPGQEHLAPASRCIFHLALA